MNESDVVFDNMMVMYYEGNRLDVMKCSSPVKKFRIVKGTRYWYSHRCGQCVSCRITKRMAWTLRILLESKLYADSSFVTLTYDDEHYPSDGNLSKDDLQRFIKRLRRRLGDHKIRYYACGEYGEKSGRAHYHLIVFGMSSVLSDQIVKDAWTQGFSSVAPISRERAAYVAKHNSKFMTKEEIGDRVPEFSLMSRRPGIGNGMVPNIVKAMKQGNVNFMDDDGFMVREKLPTVMRFQGRLYPVDNYLRNKIVDMLGLEDDELSNHMKFHFDDFNSYLINPEETYLEQTQSYLRAEKHKRQRSKGVI